MNQALTTLNFVNEYLCFKLRDIENVQNEKYYFQKIYYFFGPSLTVFGIDSIRRCTLEFTLWIFVFSPNLRKCGPEKTSNSNTFFPVAHSTFSLDNEYVKAITSAPP